MILLGVASLAVLFALAMILVSLLDEFGLRVRARRVDSVPSDGRHVYLVLRRDGARCTSHRHDEFDDAIAELLALEHRGVEHFSLRKIARP